MTPEEKQVVIDHQSGAHRRPSVSLFLYRCPLCLVAVVDAEGRYVSEAEARRAEPADANGEYEKLLAAELVYLLARGWQPYEDSELFTDPKSRNAHVQHVAVSIQKKREK
jgi:hypothetical protein